MNPAADRRFRAPDALAVLLLAVCAWIGVPALLLSRLPDPAVLALTSLGLLAAVVLGARVRDRRFAPLVAPGRFSAEIALCTLVGTAGLSLVMMHLSEPLLDLFRWLGVDYRSDIEDLRGRIEAIHPVAVWLLVAGLVPVAEEAVFRGAVLKGFRASWGTAGALVASSVLFAAIHVLPPRVVVTFTLGLWLGALAIRSGGLLAPILAHAVNNALVLLLMSRGVDTVPIASAAAGGVAFVISAWRIFMQGSESSVPS